MSKPVIIVDIDNCIADDAWRIPYINWSATDLNERYHVYHALAYYDRPSVQWLCDYIPNIKGEVRVFALTARPTAYSALTEKWLQDKVPLPVESVLMRNNDDHRHSLEVKRAQVGWLLSTYNVKRLDVIGAFDDRQDVVDMYNEVFGNNVGHRRAIHDVCAYTNPLSKQTSVPEILRSAAGTYEARNAVYGDNYKNVGNVMAALFPNGVNLGTPEQFNQWHLLELMVVKLTRFANSGLEHEDSIHDAQVYGAMVQSLIKKGTFK